MGGFGPALKTFAGTVFRLAPAAGPAGFFVSLAISIAASVVLSAILPQPKRSRPNFARQVGGRQEMVRQAIAPRRTVYGELLLSGTIVYVETYGSSANEFLSLVVVFADHEIEDFGTWYFNDRELTLDGDAVQGVFANLAWIYRHTGLASQDADPELVAQSDGKWTAEHQLNGVAYAHIKLRSSQTVFPDGMPTVKVKIKGKKIFDTRTSTTVYSTNPALMLRDYLVTRLGATAAEIDDATVIAAANVCDELVTLADQPPEEFLVDDPGTDVLTLNAPVNALLTGDAVQVASAGTLPAGLAAVTTYYWIANGSTTGKLATTYLNAIAGTPIDITDAGTGEHTITRTSEARYAAHGTVADNERPADAIQAILGAMAGTITQVGGEWKIYAGVAAAATITLDEDDLSGPLVVTPRLSRREIFNAVKPAHVDPLKDYQVTTAPMLSNTTYETQDGGNQIVKTLELPFTLSPTMAQRLGKIELERVRQQISVEYPAKPGALRLQVWDVVKINNARFGWSGKDFRVAGLTINPDLSVHLSLREEAAAMWAWSQEETTVDPAPDTNLPDPFTVPAPTTLTLESGTAQLLEAADGTVHSRIRVTWTVAADSFVVQHEVQFKRSSDTTWAPGPPAPTPQNEVFLAPVADGKDYDMRVRAMNSIGADSPWLTSTNHTVIGKTAAPAEPNVFLVSRMADGTRRFTWAGPTPLPADVRTGGGFKIRYLAGSTSDWSAMTDLHDGVLKSSPYETNDLAAGTYSFAIKTVDSSNNESATAKFIELTIGDPRLKNVLLGRFEHEIGFPGSTSDEASPPALTGFVDGDGVLRNRSNQTWNDLPSTWSALAATWETIVSAASPLVYATPQIDLGVDVNFTPLVTVEGTGTQTIKMKTGTSADGSVVAAWVDLAPVVGKRYVQVQIQMAGLGSPPGHTKIRLLTVLLDGEVVTEEREDVNTATETGSWFESVAAGHFRVVAEGAAAITQAGLVLQNVGAGWTWELVSKSATLGGSPVPDPATPAAEFKIYNASNTLADATVDVTLKGPK